MDSYTERRRLGLRTIVWFRGKDLRVGDHEPLARAAAEGEVIPLFVLEPRYFGPGRAGRAPHRMQFLLKSLAGLQESLSERGSGLVLLEGPSPSALPRVAAQWRVDRVWAHRGSEPGGRARDNEVAGALDVPLRLFEGETLTPPGSIRTRAGRPFSVFTPFKRAFLKEAFADWARPAPESLPPLPAGLGLWTGGVPDCTDIGLVLNPRVLEGGEQAARKRLRTFFAGSASLYETLRHRLDLGATSRLSADLKFGTLSAREVWQRSWENLRDTPSGTAFRDQLLWREFGYHTLWDRPEVLRRPFRSDFLGFPWEFNEERWTAWTEGRTGFPLVDASARQLLREGWVPNRARMISASFLTKQLLIDYRLGEAHYLKYLVDGDPAQNNLGWQWSAGCGCDAQPWFRVFNPVRQGDRFDPSGSYVRRWLPRLGRLPNRYIHRPWEAPAGVLEEAGVRLGKDYPYPVVDPSRARDRFLKVARDTLRGRGVDAEG
ncbi:MAG: deoxyribodipyrimidine photo-lyase [Acidobacteria bacterium]|nr:deoxyribodipyrimidine photo-lyase [Acidobacteriota bacterium]